MHPNISETIYTTEACQLKIIFFYFVKWMFWYFMICQWQWHGIQRDITDPLNMSHAAKYQPQPCQQKYFQKYFKRYFMNIFNDSGMECSAIYQRPYTEACQLELNISFFWVKLRQFWISMVFSMTVARISMVYNRSLIQEYQPQPCPQKYFQ